MSPLLFVASCLILGLRAPDVAVDPLGNEIIMDEAESAEEKEFCNNLSHDIRGLLLPFGNMNSNYENFKSKKYKIKKISDEAQHLLDDGKMKEARMLLEVW